MDGKRRKYSSRVNTQDDYYSTSKRGMDNVTVRIAYGDKNWLYQQQTPKYPTLQGDSKPLHTRLFKAE